MVINLLKGYQSLIVVAVIFKTSSTLLKLGNEVLVILNNDVLYIDDDHLSLSGTNLFKERLKEFILESFIFSQTMKNKTTSYILVF